MWHVLHSTAQHSTAQHSTAQQYCSVKVSSQMIVSRMQLQTFGCIRINSAAITAVLLTVYCQCEPVCNLEQSQVRLVHWQVVAVKHKG
jgi:hypothetical protein